MGAIYAIQVTGSDRRNGDEENKEVLALVRLVGELQGVCAPLGWAALPGGGRQ